VPEYRSGAGAAEPRAWSFSLVLDGGVAAWQAAALRPVMHLLDDGAGAVTRVRLVCRASTLAEAVEAGVRAVERKGLTAIRLNAEDWVTLADVAARVGRSRETVRLWATGRLGPGGFPSPLTPGRGTVFYSWAEVLAWLCRHGRIDGLEEEPLLAAVSLALQLRTLTSRLVSAPSAQCVRRLALLPMSAG